MSKFRIVEVINSYDRTSEWIVQEKCMFIWWPIQDLWLEEVYNFGSYENAKEYVNRKLKEYSTRIRKVKEEC